MSRGKSLMKTVVTAGDDGVAKIWTFNEHEVTLAGMLSGDSMDAKHNGAITSIACWSNQEGLRKVLTTSKDCTAKVWMRSEHTVEWHAAQCFPALPESKEREITEEERLKAPFQKIIDLKKSMTAEGRLKKAKEAAEALRPEVGHFRPITMGQWCPLQTHMRGPEGMPLGHRAVTCSEDSSVVLWNADTGRRVATLQSMEHGHNGPVRHCSWSGSKRELRLLTSSDDGSINIWDGKTGVFQRKFEDKRETRESSIWCAYFSAYEQDAHVLSVSQKGVFEGRVHIWDTNHGNLLETIGPDVTPDKKDKHEDNDPSRGKFGWTSVLHADWMSPEPQRPRAFLAWNFDGQVAMIDWTKKDCCKVFGSREEKMPKAHNACVWTVQAGRKETYQILTSSHDSTAAIWDIRKENQAIYSLEGHSGVLWNASFSPDDHWVVTCSEDRTARAFRVDENRTVISGSSGPSSTQRLFGKVLSENSDDSNATTHRLAVNCVDWECRSDPWNDLRQA